MKSTMTNSSRVTDKENYSNSSYMEHLRFSMSSYGQKIDDYEENEAPRRDEDEKGYPSRVLKEQRSSHGTDCSHDSHTTKQRGQSISNNESTGTIALFGAYGKTGQYFLQLAMEAGYRVRALILPGVELEDVAESESLTLVTGTIDDESKIRRVVRKAAYVVCMLNDCDHILQSSSRPSNLDFIRKLVPIMGECRACKILLYQASSFASDNKGVTPLFSNVIKKMAVRKSRRENLHEQDRIVKCISKHSSSEEVEYPFHYIVTRPSDMVWDRPSRKKLAASKSLPGPFPITNFDLAEFSLNALRMEKLYDSCPYVVQDGM